MTSAMDEILAVARKMSGEELYADAEHWVTLHPNGHEHTGSPALINGAGQIIGGAAAKEQRKVLGHVSRTLSDMAANGFDVKSALSNGNVKMVAASPGKACGLAWQHNGVGHFCISPGKRLNQAYIDQQRKLAQQRQERGQTRWTISAGSNDEIAATIRHEIAHALGMQAHIDSPKKLGEIFRKLHGSDYGAINKWIKENISEYAATNIKETDAELAAMVTAPDYQRGSLPKELEDHVDWLFKKASK